MLQFHVYPGGKKRIVTFSYDDGSRNDPRLIELFNKYGVKVGIEMHSPMTPREPNSEAFNRAIERALGLPFIIPGGGRVALLCALTLLSCAGAGALIAALSAWRISRLDTGRILREGS